MTYEHPRAFDCPIPGRARAVLFAGNDNKRNAIALVNLAGVVDVHLATARQHERLGLLLLGERQKFVD